MDELKQRLDELAEKYNSPEYFTGDPIIFPKRFSDKRDIEISAFVTSVIAWGRRPMILRNAERIHQLMSNEPYRFVMEGDIEAIGEDNLHRTFFGRHLRYMLRGLRAIYEKSASLETFAVKTGATDAAAPSWHLAENINRIMADENRLCTQPLTGPSRCLPDDAAKSALKRFNMALRWLVRNDGKVDIGIWEALKPSQLFIPLDVHAARTARTLGLLQRKANDRRAVEELTENLRKYRPCDPAVYDFALFGAGEAGEY